MRKLLFFLLLLALVPVSHAQEDDGRIIVGFVEGHGAGGYRLNDTSGFSRLTVMINDVGGIVREVTLGEPISEEVDLLILHGPKTALTEGENARIWIHLQRGGDLLVLNDSPPNQGLPGRSGLNELLWEDYGIRWRDDIIAGMWWSEDTLATVSSRSFRNQPQRKAALTAEPLPDNPVTGALLQYNLPVYYWHGRSLQLRQPAFRGDPVPILQTIGTPYGETTPRGVPELNLGPDTLGVMTLGAYVQDRETGARIVVIGDSDMFKNGYGLEYVNGNEVLPLFPGNDLLARQLVSWLLTGETRELTIDNRYVQSPIDGFEAGWERLNTVVDDTAPDDLDRLVMARSDRRLYALLEAPALEEASSFLMTYTSDDSEFSVVYELGSGTVEVVEGTQRTSIETSRYAVGEIFEASLPLQVLPRQFTITEVCLVTDEAYCADTNITSIVSSGMEMRGKHVIAGLPLVRVMNTTGDVLRAIPQADAPNVVEVNFGEFLSVLETSEDGTWLHVSVDGQIGWIPASDVQPQAGVSEEEAEAEGGQ